MTKYTQRELRRMIANERAENISDISVEESEQIRKKEGYCTQIGWAYGCNGKLFQGKNTKTLYAITDRTLALFIF
ncbi:MAG: hypothetical protein Q4D95_03295 [Peptoniphilus sp.]|nr:hypothetical protein [Peptoniphilus sp.]